jgi:group I intron endonuclease
MFKRKNRHFSELRNNKHKNSKLQNSFNKHGFEFFIFYVLEFINDKNELIVREQYHIDKDKPEYNINLIANSSLGVKRSEETKEKVRQANLGLKHPEWRNKIKSESQGGDNHWTKNKEFSDESKKKMSESQKKLYENGYQNHRKGVKESFEIIEAKKIKASKPIQQFTLEGELVEEFASAKEAKNKYGYHPMYIGQCCNLKRKTYKGYEWKFKE